MILEFNDYLILNKKGIFPAPSETEEEFCKRIPKLLTSIPLPGEALTETEWQEAHQTTENIFDIKPTWVPAFYWNKKISLWEAAAAWDYEGRAVVQLRTQLKKGRWAFLEQQEVLAHEAAHATRMAFSENRFEEMICYQTSRFSWRRKIGPLFRKPYEALLCVGFAALGWLLSVLGFFTWAFILPWLPFFFFFLRLLYDRRVFNRCLSALANFALPGHVTAVVLRLTDREILFFSHASKSQINAYIQEHSANELRWKILKEAYLS